MIKYPKGSRIVKIANNISDIIYKAMMALAHIFSLILINLGNFVMLTIKFFVNNFRPFINFFHNFTKTIQHQLGAFFPSNIKKALEKTMLYSGITQNPEETLGITALYSIIIPVTAGIVAHFIFHLEYKTSAVVAIISFIVVWLIMYMVLSFLVDRRTSSIEAMLPDMLSLISQNISAGMTPYNAMWVAARPEFGPLAVEIQKVAKDTLTGIPLDTALINMTKRIKSAKLERSIKLMIQGMRSGGELPTVLQGISRSIQTEQNLFKRMKSETSAQSMFIMFSVVVGAPLLFAASSQFIRIFSQIFESMDLSKLSGSAQCGITISPIPISYDFFITYSLIMLVILGFFGSLLIGLMRNGKLTSGIPIMPVTIFLSIVIFFLLIFILSSFFGGIVSMSSVG